MSPNQQKSVIFSFPSIWELRDSPRAPRPAINHSPGTQASLSSLRAEWRPWVRCWSPPIP